MSGRQHEAVKAGGQLPTLVKGQPGVTLELQVSYHKGRKHLPVVALNRAA